jgi:hypothetical protein
MAINLSGYGSVGVAFCVRVDIPGIAILRLTDYHGNLNIEESDGVTYEYAAAGTFLGISDSTQDLRATGQETVISLSGIPISYAVGVQALRIKGSDVDVRRVFLDSITDSVLDIAGNPVIMFRGAVSNYGFSETFNEFSQDSSLVITLACKSIIDVLRAKITGRRTNREDMRASSVAAGIGFTDTSFDRVTVISNRPFDFGRKPENITSGTGTASTNTQVDNNDGPTD